mgnify:CR=1 FL=1
MARRIVMAAPAQGTFDSGTAATVTITVSEPGVVHLADLCVGAQRDAIIGGGGTEDNDPTDFEHAIGVRSILVDGVREYTTGRNTPMAPGGLWSPRRRGNFALLPDLYVGRSTTIAVTGFFTRTSGTGVLRACVPMTPDRLRAVPDGEPPLGPDGERWASSPDETIDGAGDDGTAVLTASDAGWYDLSRLAVASMSTLGHVMTTDAFDADDHDRVRLNILGLAIGPTREDVIVGDGTVSAPPIFESDRARNWGPTGWIYLAQGDTLTLDVEHSGAGTTLDGLFHFGLPYRAGHSGPINGFASK